jgi:hypothetical protein
MAPVALIETYRCTLHLAAIPYGRVTDSAVRCFLFILAVFLLLGLLAFNCIAIVGFLKVVRAALAGRLPRTVRGMLQAVREQMLYLVPTAIALYLDILWWIDSRTRPGHPVGSNPLVDLDNFQRVSGAILILVTLSFFLVVVKQLFLRLYAVLEFACGIVLAGYSVWKIDAEAQVWQLIPPISSLYFLVRAIEDFKKDWEQREDGTHDKLAVERYSRYLKLKWPIERFVRDVIIDPFKRRLK